MCRHCCVDCSPPAPLVKATVKTLLEEPWALAVLLGPWWEHQGPNGEPTTLQAKAE